MATSATFTPETNRPSRRQQILDAAAHLFARRGFHGVSMDDIGAAIGISGPGLYRHFDGKDAILGEMLVGISDRLLTEAWRRIAGVERGEAALRALVAWHVEFALDHPALISVQSRDLANLDEPDRRQVRQLQRRYVETWVEAIRDAVPDAKETCARSAAHAVFGLINSTPHSAMLDRKATAGLLYRMAIAALVTPATLTDAQVGATEASAARLMFRR